MGEEKPGNACPVNVQLTAAHHVQHVLKAAHRLRKCEEEFSTVYFIRNDKINCVDKANLTSE